jgi:hypothetical protein
MDADLSHQPEAIADLIQKSGGADLVIGSRYVPGGRIDGWSWRRHAASRGAMLFSRTLLGLSARDVTSGFRLWRADLLAAILVHPIASNGYAFQEEMLYRAQRAGGRIVEVPITFVDRVSGASKLHWRDVAEFFSVMIKLKLYDREK